MRVLAIDQGTTSTRAIVFDGAFDVRGLAQQELAQHFPAPGLVEHEPHLVAVDHRQGDEQQPRRERDQKPDYAPQQWGSLG